MSKTAMGGLAILVLTFVGCKPDLVVKELDVTWNDTSKVAKAVIANIGDVKAGEFMVYFNGEENPVSPNHRPQVSHVVHSLEKGQSVELKADFAPLAHPDNNNLGNVFKIVVLVDPKDMVKEKNENNNQEEYPLQ